MTPQQPRESDCTISILASGPDALRDFFDGAAPEPGIAVEGPQGVAAKLVGETEAVGFEAGTFVYDVLVNLTAGVPAGVIATWICGRLARTKEIQAVQVEGRTVDIHNVEDVAKAIRLARLG